MFKIGDKVVKNPETWIVSEFDVWGRGEGIGVVVEPLIPLNADTVDIRWPAGRCFENVKELIRNENEEI